MIIEKIRMAIGDFIGDIAGISIHEEDGSCAEALKKLLWFSMFFTMIYVIEWSIISAVNVHIVDRVIKFTYSVLFLYGVVYWFVYPLGRLMMINCTRREKVKVNNRNRYMRIKADIIAQWCLVIDTLEFEIVKGKKTLRIGTETSSSEGVIGNVCKSYYIDTTSYSLFEDFIADLILLTVQGKLNVISMDGIKIDKQLRRIGYWSVGKDMTRVTGSRGLLQDPITEETDAVSSNLPGEKEMQTDTMANRREKGGTNYRIILMDRFYLLVIGSIYYLAQIFYPKSIHWSVNLLIAIALLFLSKELLLFPIDLFCGKKKTTCRLTGIDGPNPYFFYRKVYYSSWAFVGDKDYGKKTVLINPVNCSKYGHKQIDIPPFDRKLSVTYYRFSRILCSWEEE